MSINLNVGEGGEKLADEQGLLTPMDVFVFFQIYKDNRERGGRLSTISLEDFSGKEIWKEKSFTREKLLTSLFHLKNKDLIDFRPPPGISDHSLAFFQLNQWGFFRMEVPVDVNEISDEDLERLMYRKMLEAKKRIDGWMKIEKATKEIEEVRKELEKSQRDTLRSMIGIFGIFVAIFSFIVIGTNTALSVGVRGYRDLFVILFIFGVLFLILCGFLRMTKWFTNS